ncbi:hypothetical protein A2U01_0018298 [Trifolium medium]|uniref:Uncharacterized protein n=1 Tax=Trifolium medium TaxID=97028 RepID=A0A392NFI2_9FABA|nr:hypothetical protein [Trifolium medium]
MCLRAFKETEIKSGVSGSEIILTQSNIAQLLSLPNKGVFRTFTPTTGKKSPYVKRIAQECYINEEATPTNKVSDMKETQRLLMKEEGIIITGDDIAQVSPLKDRKDSSESDEDLPASGAIDIAGTEGASDAHVSKGKEPMVSDTVVTTPKRKKG